MDDEKRNPYNFYLRGQRSRSIFAVDIDSFIRITLKLKMFGGFCDNYIALLIRGRKVKSLLFLHSR